MDYAELMADFVAKLNVEGAEPDADGVYHFEIDGMPVSMMEVAELQQLVVWGDLGDLPPAGNRERLYRTMMEAMFMGEGTGGSSFSIDRGSGRVFLQRFLSLVALDPDGFMAQIERFVNVLEEWRKLIADFRELSPEPERAGAAPAASPAEEPGVGFGLGGFMQV